MELLNMFSDLAPISNNGYRKQLYTDPGILQGIEFLQNENKVKNEVEQTMSLHMISDSHGSESTTVHSAGMLNNENSGGFDGFDGVKEGFMEGLDGTTSSYYSELKKQYDEVQKKFNELIAAAKNPNTGAGKGIFPAVFTAKTSVETDTAFATRLGEYIKTEQAARKKLKDDLTDLSTQMQDIASKMMTSVKDNTSLDFRAYNRMQKEIDNAQRRIVEVYTIIKNNEDKKPYDIDTSLAKEEETALLTKQRYYVYILWFITMVIVLYITISNLINPDSSFSALLISLILLVGLFVFFIYSKWDFEWYDFKYSLKNFNLSLPDIPKINFNPLVSIKYTS
jgi:hypothetical protein